MSQLLTALAGELTARLKQSGLIAATAESCTGGMAAQYMTSAAGTSEVFECGIVSYANRIKVQELGVSEDTLARTGAVSRETALEMAEGVRARSASDLGLSTTGIAGPGGGTPEKPVGTVHIAACLGERSLHRQLALEGSRQEIREATVECLFRLALELLEGPERLEPQAVSSRLRVRRLREADTETVLALCSGNGLFYQYHPPKATRESVLQDLIALPPGKSLRDKYFLGCFDGESLAAVLDLVTDYPEKGTAYMGFFMVDSGLQGKGFGSALLEELAECLLAAGFEKIRLAIDEGNPQSEAFWSKNRFVKTGERIPNERAAYLLMERDL